MYSFYVIIYVWVGSIDMSFVMFPFSFYVFDKNNPIFINYKSTVIFNTFTCYCFLFIILFGFSIFRCCHDLLVNNVVVNLPTWCFGIRLKEYCIYVVWCLCVQDRALKQFGWGASTTVCYYLKMLIATNSDIFECCIKEKLKLEMTKRHF